MSAPIHRITLFKVNNDAGIKRLEELYTELLKTQSKDGKPYILSIQAGPADFDQRSQNYNFCAKTTFANASDMAYYDTTCAAHSKMKIAAKEEALVSGLLTVYFTPTIEFSSS